jgi:hypothetical protein
MAKQSREKTVSTSKFERLAEEFIGSTLDISEQCLRAGRVKGSTRAAIPHAAMSVLYAVKAFLALAKQDATDE